MLIGYRSLGIFSSNVPFSIFTPKDKVPLLIVPVDDVFFTYYIDKLRLRAVSDKTPNSKPIVHVCSDQNSIFAAAGSFVYRYVGFNRIISAFQHDKKVVKSMPFGETLVVAYDNGDILVFDLHTEEIIQTIPKIESYIVDIFHPPTYMNKIIVAYESKKIILLNVKTGKLIHTFTSEIKGTPVQLCQTPVKGIVAIASKNAVDVLNIETDELLFTLKHDEIIKSVSFRSDGIEQAVVALSTGELAVWNLENKRLVGKKAAHNGAIVSAQFLNNQGLLASNGVDNSVNLWYFESGKVDSGVSMPELQVKRYGHRSNVTNTKFFENGILLSSDNKGHLSSWAVERPSNCLSLGRAKTVSNKKARKEKASVDQPWHLSDFSFLEANTARKNDWACIVGAHENLLTFWSMDTKKQLGFLKFEETVTALTMTKCGNFCFCGFDNGTVRAVNMQSFQQRVSFKASNSSIRFISVNIQLTQIITAGSSKIVNIWKWNAGENKVTKTPQTVTLSSAVDDVGGKTIIPGKMLLLALTDFSLVILSQGNTGTWNVSRSFEIGMPISAFTVSKPDNQFVVASTIDRKVMTFDVLSGEKIDAFQIKYPVVSLDWDPEGKYMVSAHLNQRGIYLWVNSYAIDNTQISKWDESKPIPLKSLPGIVIDDEPNESIDLDTDFSTVDDLEIREKFENACTLVDGYITLSKTSEVKWATLPQLNELKQKSKPLAPLKKPEKAPFFLETKKLLGNADFEFVTDKNAADKQEVISTISHADALCMALDNDGHQEMFDLFERYSPSQIDRELRSLTLDENDQELGKTRLLKFLTKISEKLATKTDYELCNAYLSIFLNIHEDWILEENSTTSKVDDKIIKMLEHLSKVLITDGQTLSSVFDQCLTVSNWLRHSLIT